tara:strand:- start:5646 stop:6230 length:585 start_codon:yes stop_codon:yes gene_type:complete
MTLTIIEDPALAKIQDGLINKKNRQAILNAVPENGILAEWGLGGTTIWFLENMKGDQFLYSIEHNKEWATQIAGQIGEKKLNNKHSLHLREPEFAYQLSDTETLNTYATPLEECPAGLMNYIIPIDVFASSPDVFLIDGVARGACLAMVRMFAKPGSIVFLHDWNGRENWYGWAVRLYGEKVEKETENLLKLVV